MKLIDKFVSLIEAGQKHEIGDLNAKARIVTSEEADSNVTRKLANSP